MTTYAPFTSAPLALSCKGTTSVAATLYPMGGMKSDAELKALANIDLSLPVQYAADVQTVSAMTPGLIFRLELALSSPTSANTTFSLSPASPSHLAILGIT